jgi:hypothetical protein
VTLRCIAEIERRGLRNAELPPGVTGPERAQRAVLRFLQQQDCVMQHNAAAPILRLNSAISDLADGRVSPMFRPVNRRPGRRTTSRVEALIMGMAARAMSELMEAGATLDEAARQVAQAIRAGGVIGHKKISAATVKNWRARIMEGPGAAPPEAIAHFREPLWPDATAARRGKNLLTVLRQAGARLGREESQEPGD